MIAFQGSSQRTLKQDQAPKPRETTLNPETASKLRQRTLALPGKPVDYRNGLLCLNDGLLLGMVAHYFGLYWVFQHTSAVHSVQRKLDRGREWKLAFRAMLRDLEVRTLQAPMKSHSFSKICWKQRE